MRVTSWFCLLGLASACALAACGGDDDDGQAGPAGGSAGTGGGGGAGGAGGADAGGGGSGGGAVADEALRQGAIASCREACRPLSSTRCAETPSERACSAACNDLAPGLSAACVTALRAHYDCTKVLAASAYTCVDGKPVVTGTRQCAQQAQALQTECAGQLGAGGAGGAGGTGGAGGGGGAP